MAVGHAAPDEIFGNPFRCRDDPHLFGDDAAPGVFYKTHGPIFAEKS